MLEDILRDNEHDEEASILLAKINIKQNNFDNAINISTDLLKNNPNNTDANSVIGFCLIKKNRNKEALEYLNKTYAYEKKDVNLLNNIALANLNIAKYKEAENFAKQGLKINSSSDVLNYLLASIYKKNRNRIGAIKQLDKVRKINPKFKAHGISINQIIFINKYVRFPLEELFVLTLIGIGLIAGKIFGAIAFLALAFFYIYISYFYRMNKLHALLIGFYVAIFFLAFLIRLLM